MTGKEAITTQFGNVSSVIIGEQANYADESLDDVSSPVAIASNGARSGGDFYRYQPRVNNSDLAATGTTIANTFWDSTASQSKDAAGSSSIANGMVILFSGDGTALPLSMLTQTLNPTWRIWGGTGQNLPAAVNVIDDQALSSDSSSLTIANNLSAVTSPVQLALTPAEDAIPSTAASASVRIVGTDNSDRAINETIRWVQAAPTATLRSKHYYKTVTGATSQGWTAGAANKITATARDTSVEVIFTPQDLRLVRYWTIVLNKGLVPNIYYGCILNQVSLEVSNEAFLGMACTFLGRRQKLYTNLAGDTGPTATPDSRSALQEASANIFSGPQTKLFAEGGIELSMTDLTINFSQELEYINTFGQRFQAAAPGRSTKRLVSFEGTQVYSPQNNMSEYFENNTTMSDIRLQALENGLGLYPFEANLEADEGQFTTNPDPAVSEEGAITQDSAFKLIRATGQSAEYRWRCRYPVYDQVRIYT